MAYVYIVTISAGAAAALKAYWPRDVKQCTVDSRLQPVGWVFKTRRAAVLAAIDLAYWAGRECPNAPSAIPSVYRVLGPAPKKA